MTRTVCVYGVVGLPRTLRVGIPILSQRSQSPSRLLCTPFSWRWKNQSWINLGNSTLTPWLSVKKRTSSSHWTTHSWGLCAGGDAPSRTTKISGSKSLFDVCVRTLEFPLVHFTSHLTYGLLVCQPNIYWSHSWTEQVTRILVSVLRLNTIVTINKVYRVSTFTLDFVQSEDHFVYLYE